jgi:hypothetical protein
LDRMLGDARENVGEPGLRFASGEHRGEFTRAV